MANTQSLYAITDEISLLMEQVEAAAGEVTEEHEALLKSVEESLTAKTDNVVEWVYSQEDMITTIEIRMKQLSDVKNQIENRLEKFDSYVDACLKRSGKESLDGTLYQIKKRKPSIVCVIEDETLIPFNYVYTPPVTSSISKKLITDDLKAGKEVPGAKLEESKTISITYVVKKAPKSKKAIKE